MAQDWAQWQGEVVDGAFRLDRYLGSSEHSAVFVTESQGQRAAIKLRSGEPREEPGAGLSHPHLLRILKTGRWQRDGTPLSYVVMEHADEVLATFVPERSLDVEEARETLMPVLEALAYLHDRGLVHGRIKPSNILSIKEKLKVSSDGLRRAGETSRLAGESGPYDAPEVSEGRFEAAVDVWSVGATVVEMLTQQLPVFRDAGDPVLPAVLPDVFRDIANHCLRLDPRQRWSIAQISDRLAGRVPAATVAEAAKAERPRAPHKSKTAAWVAAVAAGVVVVGGALLVRPRTAEDAPAASTVAHRQEPAPAAPAAPAAEEKPASTPRRARGKVEHAAEPDVSPKSLGTIQGRVKVRMTVRVDSSGKVVETKLDTPRVSRYFTAAALQAARRWRFVPPMEDGAAVASSWSLEFDFSRGGTQIHSRQL